MDDSYFLIQEEIIFCFADVLFLRSQCKQIKKYIYHYWSIDGYELNLPLINACKSKLIYVN